MGVVDTENATTTTGFALDPTSTGQINCGYDGRDQLVAVIDQAGEAAIYRYDSVGNLLAIDRQLAADVSIIEFMPDVGATNVTVTIFGTRFGSTSATNSVTFNGVAAFVLSASDWRQLEFPVVLTVADHSRPLRCRGRWPRRRDREAVTDDSRGSRR